MPFKTTPEIDFSAVGLITDVPTHSLPDGAWNDCLNLRCKDGSVQGVNTFKPEQQPTQQAAPMPTTPIEPVAPTDGFEDSIPF